MRSGRCKGLSMTCMTFSTRLVLADIFSRFRWSILRTGFSFQCNLYTVLQSLSNFLFPSYNSNVHKSGYLLPNRPTRTQLHVILLLLLRLLSTVYCLLLSTLLQSTFRSLLPWFKGPRTGISRSTAHYLAPASFLYGFAARSTACCLPPTRKTCMTRI